MSGFALCWLRLRERFDASARSLELAHEFALALRRHPERPLRLLDLASGSGASFRALAPLIDVEQVWSLTDCDEALLAAQADEIARWSTERECGSRLTSTRWQIRSRCIDLARALDEIDLARHDGVTTSAFLDLVSASWLDRFAAMISAWQGPLLATLNVDGRRCWHPAMVEDADVLAAFEAHQSRDKGFGPALGPAAADHLANRLRAAGYDVQLGRSDWRIGPQDIDMLQPLLDDTLNAACEARPEQSRCFERWADARRRQMAAGGLSLAVGHLDLLALPAASRPSFR